MDEPRHLDSLILITTHSYKLLHFSVKVLLVRVLQLDYLGATVDKKELN